MEMIHLNQNNTIKLGMSFFLLVLISICGNGKTGLGKLLNRMDNNLNKFFHLMYLMKIIKKQI